MHMAKCNFSIDFTGAPDILIGRAYDAITNADGIFNGDPEKGTFSISTPLGRIAGEYRVSEQIIHFAINDKPFLLGCGRIEDELRKYIR